MSDKVKKFLAKLNAKELSRVHLTLQQIDSGNLDGLNVKVLKGKLGYIRIRVGRVRIICEQVNGVYQVLHITNRNEKTYKDL